MLESQGHLQRPVLARVIQKEVPEQWRFSQFERLPYRSFVWPLLIAPGPVLGLECHSSVLDEALKAAVWLGHA